MAFNTWVAQLNRLPTRARIARWSPENSPLCCLCNSFDETRDHLLITCDYSAAVWSLVLLRLNRTSSFHSWSELMSWIRLSSSQSPSTLRILRLRQRSTTSGSSATTSCTTSPPSLLRQFFVSLTRKYANRSQPGRKGKIFRVSCFCGLLDFIYCLLVGFFFSAVLVLIFFCLDSLILSDELCMS